MRTLLLPAAALTALSLGACSMFHHSQAPSSMGNARSQQAPQAYAGSSQPSSTASVTADELRQAQQELKNDGDYKGQIDGKFGPETAQALKQYQQKNGLQPTGKLDQQTVAQLGINEASGSSTPPTRSNSGSNK